MENLPTRLNGAARWEIESSESDSELEEDNGSELSSSGRGDRGGRTGVRDSLLPMGRVVSAELLRDALWCITDTSFGD